MSSVYLDRDIEIVVLTLQSRANPSSETTYLIGQDHYPADELYSGSPVVYPLLVGQISTKRSVGVNLGNLGSMSCSLYGNLPLTAGGASLYDLMQENEFKDSILRARYYSKADSSLTTHSANNIRWTGRIEDVVYQQNGIITLKAREEFFRDKQIVHRLYKSDFEALGPTNFEDAYDGAIASTVFGKAGDGTNGIAIDAPVIDVDQDDFNWRLYAGTYPQTSHDPPAVKKVYIANSRRELSPRKWLYTDIGSAVLGGLENADYDNTSTEVNLRDEWCGFLLDNVNTKCLTSVYARLKRYGTHTEDDGELRCEIQKAVYNSAYDTYTPDGRVIASVTMDPSSISAATEGDQYYFNFKPPVLLPSDHKYLVMFNWTNLNSTNYVVMFRGGSSTAAFDSYKKQRSTTDRDAPWIVDTNNLHAGAYGLVNDATTQPVAITNKHRLMSYGLKCGSPAANTYTGSQGLQFRLEVTGIEDSGGNVIENPSDIIKTILTADGQFLNMSEASRIDSTSFASVKTSLSDVDMLASVIVAKESFALEVIRDICRQFRIVMYETTNGKLALYFPEAISQTGPLDYWLSEVRNREDFRLESVSDTPIGDLVNNINIQYSPNLLDAPVDRSIEELQDTNRFTGSSFVKDGASSDNDGDREYKATNSNELYGIRQMKERAVFIDKEERAVRLRNYYFDNFYKTQKEVVVRLRRDRNYLSDFFDTWIVKHSELFNKSGTSSSVKVFNDGTASEVYIDGVPSIAWAAGTLRGEVVEVETTRTHVRLKIKTRDR